MNGFKKDELKRDLCKSHANRCERESVRVCPSKLSKRELEDLYFTVLENNVELKRTINGQEEKIKALSTKVQRMTVAQKIPPGRDNGCCTHIKSIVNQQKQSIADLKKANERMSEKIRVLNMRLCSAKQFLRRSPATSMSRCTKCSAPPTSLKNSSVSIVGKQSDSNAKSAGVSSQYLDKDARLSTRTVETETSEQEKEHPGKLCNENKCTSLIEELKQKIVDLQEEVSRSHEEYSSRISRLEAEVSELSAARARAQAQLAAGAQRDLARADHADHLAARLRAAEANYADLAMELSIEKRKVAELETRVRAVDMSCAVAKTIEDHLTNTNQIKTKIENQHLDASASPSVSPREKTSFRIEVGSDTRGASEATEHADTHRRSKLSDDSGFAADSPIAVDNAKQKKTKIENHHLEASASPFVSPREKTSLRIEVGSETRGASKLSDDSGFAADSPIAMDNAKVAKKLSAEIVNRIKALQEQLDMLKESAKKPQLSEAANPASYCEPSTSSPHPAHALKSSDFTHAPHDSLVNVASEVSPILKSESYVVMKRDKENTNTNKPNAPENKVQYQSDVAMIDGYKLLHSVSVNTDMKQTFTDEFSINKEAQDAFRKAQTPPVTGLDSNLDQVAEKRPRARSDAHNSLQIPGPLPVDSTISGTPSKFSTKNPRRQRNKNGDKKQNDDNRDSVESTMSRANEVVSLDNVDPDDMILNAFKGPLVTDNKYEEKNLFLGESNATVDVLGKSEQDLDEPGTSEDVKSGELVPEHIPKPLSSRDADGYLIKVAGPSLTEKFLEDEVSYYVPTNDARTAPAHRVRMTDDVDQPTEGDHLELCSRYARVCTCPSARRRDVSVFRTCSGTLRFRTAAAPAPPLRACGCSPAPRQPPAAADTQTQTEEPSAEPAVVAQPRRKSATYSKEEPRTRTFSPDNTDCEISTLTDLPSERDGKSPRALSPGEERATPTQTDYSESCTPPTTTEYGTLSEGEMPAAPGGHRKSSLGEAKVNFQETSKGRSASGSQSQRMEEALAAISEELARCRGLLQPAPAPASAPASACSPAPAPAPASACSPAPAPAPASACSPAPAPAPASACSPAPAPQVKSKDAALMADLCPGPIALKRAAASPRIGDAFAPKCIFTLHVGTVVLSDEAVINSRNMSLVLTWKFYDQNVTMTRMRAGRVVLFDFSTEYDVKVTDHFLNYLKYEEMQLVICEMDNQWEPFASCALRLRDSLLHANRRADMSLALTAGPLLHTARATRDDLDSGDEVGVLDLWCMLRVDPALMPDIRRALASSPPRLSPAQMTLRSSSSSASAGAGGAGGAGAGGAGPRGARCVVAADEDHSIDDRLSFDLAMRTSLPKFATTDRVRPIADNTSMEESHSRRSHANRNSMYLRQSIPESTTLQTQRKAFGVLDYEKEQLMGRASHDDASSERTKVPRPSLIKDMAMDPETLSDTRRSADIKKEHDVMSNPSKILINEVTAKIRSAYEMKQALESNQDAESQTQSTTAESWRGLARRAIPKSKRKMSSITSSKFDEHKRALPSFSKYYSRSNSAPRMSQRSKGFPPPVTRALSDIPEPLELTRAHRADNVSKKSVTYTDNDKDNTVYYDRESSQLGQNIEITVMWLALNEECDAMTNPSVQRLYVAYSLLGRSGADLETPVSLPKPASYVDKCFFQFTKTFMLNECDLPLLGHMAQCRSTKKREHSPKDCVVFTVISEPPEDPLGLDNCEDIGYAYLYLGDLLEYSAGSDSYTEVVPVLSASEGEAVCGVLSIKVDGLDVIRRCALLVDSQHKV